MLNEIARSVGVVLFLGIAAFKWRPSLGQVSFPSISQNKCVSLSLREPEKKGVDDMSTRDFYSVLSQFERSFEEMDESAFLGVLHPAMQLDKQKRKVIFADTVAGFGMTKGKLARTALFKLNFFSNGSEPKVACSTGLVRGVVGPTEQWAVFHTYLSGSEQVRFFTLFSKVPQSQKESEKFKFSVGLVMFHAQTWSHEKMAPDRLLADAAKWSSLGEPLSAWVLGEAGRRILNANPYFIPNEYAKAKLETDAYRTNIPSTAQMNQVLQEARHAWSFLDFTTVYQSGGVEPGMKFLVKVETDVLKQIELCKTATQLLADKLPGLRYRFRGIECLAYRPKEELQFPPSGGSQFLTWAELQKR